jgi:hypothetical protein
MDWKDIANAVGKAAPILGTALGGPIGGLAGALVASALGTENTPDAVSKALEADPASLEKLKEAELANKTQMQQLLVQQEQNRMQFSLNSYQAEAADRDSARKLAAQQPKDFMRPLLAIVLMALTTYIVWAVLGGHAYDEIKDTTAALTIGTLIGYVLSEAKQVLGFYFGMTQDSAHTNAVVRDFAVSPGSVTRLSALPGTASEPESASTKNPA